MPLSPQRWNRFFTALAATGNAAAALRVARIGYSTVKRRLAAGRHPSLAPAQAAWQARYRQAKQAALDRRRQALRRVTGPYARIAALAHDGRNQSEIARELGCARGVVNRRLVHLGLGAYHPDFSPPPPLTKPRPNLISSRQWDRFFQVFARRASISDACRVAGISIAPVYRRLAAARAPNAKPRAACWYARFVSAQETALDRLAAAFGRALQGVEEPVLRTRTQEGCRPAPPIRRYSDALLMFLLRAHRPHLYRDHPRTRAHRPS